MVQSPLQSKCHYNRCRPVLTTVAGQQLSRFPLQPGQGCRFVLFNGQLYRAFSQVQQLAGLAAEGGGELFIYPE